MSGPGAERLLLERVDLQRVLRRMALQIIERVRVVDQLALVGVRTRGVPLARRLQGLICDAEGVRPPLGELDITLYRDDVLDPGATPEVKPTHLPFDVTDRHLVLVDDVLFTGRTTRAALDALMDWGRPRSVRLAVLVDRGHRELPLHADFVGLSVETALEERVKVQLSEVDGVDRVVLRGQPVGGALP